MTQTRHNPFICLFLIILNSCVGVTPELNPDKNLSFNAIKVMPLITKVTEATFETGDAIGLSIVRASGAYATNERLSFDGTAFSGSLNWYDGNDAATLKAYYPYSSSFPTSFTVASDQTAGTSSSDFVSSVKSNVYPTANAVSMVFQHRLCRLSISTVDRTDKTISGVTIKGAKPRAIITDELTATVDNSSSAVDISAYKDGENYYVILPPQKVALTAAVTVGGKEMTDLLAEATLVAGNQYNITIVIEEEQIKVLLSGQVDNWNPGGELPGNDKPYITLSPSSLTFDLTGGTQSTTITINNPISGNDWSVSGTVSGFSYSRSGNTLNVTASATETARSGQFTISYPDANPVTLTVSQSAPVVSNTIYYGFGNSAQYVYENGLKKENVTSAMGRYTATNNEPTVYYFNLLIPASMTQPYDFTMGGAPMGMDTFNVRFDNKDYIHYQSYGRYAQGVTISMIAQE